MTKTDKYTRLIADILVFTLGTVLTKVVQFVLMPLYTMYMTTEAYGVAELTNNMAEFLLPLTTLCIYEAAFRYIVGSKFDKKEIFSSSISVLMFSSLASAIILIILNLFINFKYAIYLYLVLYSYSFQRLCAYYVRGKGYSKTFAFSGILDAIVLALSSVLYLIVFKMGVKGYLLAIMTGYLISGLFLVIGGKVYKDFSFKKRNNKLMKELLRYSLPLIIYNIGYWLTTMSGRYILLWNTDASTAGQYAAVMKIAAVINMLQQAFYSAFQLNNSREFESKDKEKYFSNIFKYYSCGILIFGSIILCISPILSKITLRGDFYSSNVYLPLILFVAIIYCLFCFYDTMYTTYKLTKKAVPSMIIGAIINIIVALITVKKYKIWGICFASLFCYLSQAIYRVIDTRKFVKIECNWKLIVSSIFLLVVQVVVLTFSKSIMSISISLLISFILIVVNYLIYKREINILMQTLKRKFNKNIT